MLCCIKPIQVNICINMSNIGVLVEREMGAAGGANKQKQVANFQVGWRWDGVIKLYPITCQSYISIQLSIYLSPFYWDTHKYPVHIYTLIPSSWFIMYMWILMNCEYLFHPRLALQLSWANHIRERERERERENPISIIVK